MGPSAHFGCAGTLAVLLAVTGSAPVLGQRSAGSDLQEDGQWTRPAKDFASTRYTGLDQITAKNAARLR